RAGGAAPRARAERPDRRDGGGQDGAGSRVGSAVGRARAARDRAAGRVGGLRRGRLRAAGAAARGARRTAAGRRRGGRPGAGGERELDLLRYELAEIDGVAPDEDEEREALAARDRLRHLEALRGGSLGASEALAPESGEGGAGALLAAAAGALDGVEGVDPA